MIFPNLAFNTKNENFEKQEFPIACEYAYDITTNQFLLQDGKQYFVYKNEAIKIWLYKAISTIRNKFKAYSNQFGSDLYKLISETISTEQKKMEIKRYITEMVMVNPYIKSINKIDLIITDDRVVAEVDITTIYEEGGIKEEWSIIQF